MTTPRGGAGRNARAAATDLEIATLLKDKETWRLVKYKNVSMGWFASQWKVLNAITSKMVMAEYVKQSMLIQREWERFVDSFEERNRYALAVAGFIQIWKVLRLRLPLQDRLVVEQILWDKEGPWRQLVAGFRPIAGV